MLTLIWMVLVVKYTQNKVYFLVNKTCIDILESTGKYGSIINSEHIRMRGIPTACIKYKAKQDKTSVLELYKNI